MVTYAELFALMIAIIALIELVVLIYSNKKN